MANRGGVYPVIMCGGAGTRLWPASRPSRPKQFLPLVGGATLFERTVERVAGLAGFERLVVVTGAGQRDWVEAQLGALRERTTVILEPEGRDSAPAVAVAAHHVAATDPDGIAVIVASDHHIPDAHHFRRDFDRAVEAARDGRIVTIGIRPREPSSAYGYIRPGGSAGGDVAPVEAFVEKPDAATARRYIADGYLWNSGNFIAPARTFLEELAAHASDVERDTRAALEEAEGGTLTVPLGERFRAVRKISVDYAVMEHTARASVLASDLDWSDLGAWDAVHAASAKDAAGNAVDGEAVLVDATGNLVRAGGGRPVVLQGVSGLAVVDEPDAVFVGALDRAQGVKQVVEALRAADRPEADVPREGFDPAAAAATMRRWLIGSTLPLWFSNGIDRDTGLFRESLGHDGMPAGERPRGRVPARQAWVFAVGGALGWPGPWREALRMGLDAARLYDDGDGLVRALVELDGTPASDTVHLYDQTFRLLALSAAGEAVEGAERRALDLLGRIEARFAREPVAGGDLYGLREAGGDPFQSNAHMHLLEACMAWVERGGDPRWRAWADRITALAAARFIDPEHGFLREFFDAGWDVARGEEGTVVEPGHQFEWAWLLARWARITGEGAWRERAERLFAAGQRGIDAARGVAVDTMNDRLEPVTERARLWPQTEWLKSALVLAEGASGEARQAYRREAARAYGAVRRYLDVPIQGLWRDKMLADGSFVDEPAPASSLYHLAAMVAQLCESAERLDGSGGGQPAARS